MLEETDVDSCAQAVAQVLRIIGPTPRREVIGMLLGSLRLTSSDADAVIIYALSRDILHESGELLRITDITS